MNCLSGLNCHIHKKAILKLTFCSAYSAILIRGSTKFKNIFHFCDMQVNIIVETIAMPWVFIPGL